MCFFFISLTPVGKLTYEDFFQGCQSERLEIQLWNFLLLFSSSSITESHWSHWSVSETTDWEKSRWMSAVFSTVFCDFTLIISWVSLFFLFLYFFVTAADRLLIICLYYSGDMHHSLSFNSLMIMCILAGRVLFRKTKSCTKMYKRKDKCSR